MRLRALPCPFSDLSSASRRALSLSQGCAKISSSMIGSGAKITEIDDPTLFCAAFKKSRFFLFTRREPEDPDGDDQV